MSQPVAVAVPTRGNRDALLRCVRAIAAGDRMPELLVVIDQSDDEGLEQACKAAAAPVRTIVSRQQLAGLSAARNAALAFVTQSILAVTDDDCEVDARWLDVAVSALEADPSLVAVCGPVLPIDDPTGRLVPVSSRTSDVSTTYRRTSSPWSVGSGGNLVIRTAELRAAGCYDDRLGAGSAGGAGEDVDLLHRLLRRGPIRYEAGAIVRHEQKRPEARRETRRRYGRGVGAAVALWLRAGDVRAAPVLGRWLLLRVRLLAGAARAGDLGAAADELRVLAGTVTGLAYGARVRR